MNFLNRWHIAPLFFSPIMCQDLEYGSPSTRSLLIEILKPLPQECYPRDYEFYASTEDIIAPDLGSSLPNLGLGERHYIVHGYTHDSVIRAVAEQQISSCVEWMKRLANSNSILSEFAQPA